METKDHYYEEVKKLLIKHNAVYETEEDLDNFIHEVLKLMVS